MSDEATLTVLLDQNVPRSIKPWLCALRPSWRVVHTHEVGLDSCSDADVMAWALRERSIVVTFDEDFADRPMFPVGTHHGVIRLRIWPTTVEETQAALERILASLPDDELDGGRRRPGARRCTECVRRTGG